MSEPKTYYGPWLNERPKDPPDGSIWQCRMCVYEDDERDVTQTAVACDGFLWNTNFPIFKGCRRVWPPGSVLPEPRPVFVDGDVREEFDSNEYWMIRPGLHDWWYEAVNIDRFDYDMTDDLSGWICYPIQLLEDGTPVPVPWPDQCTEE